MFQLRKKESAMMIRKFSNSVLFCYGSLNELSISFSSSAWLMFSGGQSRAEEREREW